MRPRALLHFWAVISLPLLWAIFVFLSILSLPIFVLRWVIGQLATKYKPSLATMVTGGDVVFGEDPHDPKSKLHSTLIGYTAVEGGLTLAEFQTKYLQDVVLSRNPVTGDLNYPKFQQYFESWCGYRFWKWDKSFSIEKHIRPFYHDGTFQDKPMREVDLLTLLGPLSNKPFRQGQSPWEYLYVPSYLPKGSTVSLGLVIMRVHHSLGDGYSITKSFISYACGRGPVHDLLPLANTSTEKPKSNQKHHKNALKHVIHRAKGHLSLAYDLWTLPLSLLYQLVTIDSSSWFRHPSELSRVGHLGLTRQFPVDAIKRVSHQKQVSFSAILFSAVSGGIRRFCLQEKIEVPEQIQCFAPFPRQGHPDNALVNHFSTVVVKLFPGEASTDLRLKLSFDDLNQAKRSTFPLTMIWLMTVLAAYPTWYIKLVGKNWFASSILSSFPGPTEVLSYFRKYPVPDIVFWTPHLNGNGGVGIGMLTYGGSLRFSLNVDSAIIGSQVKVQQLCNSIEQEISSIIPLPDTTHAKSDENWKKGSEPELSYGSTPAQLRLRSVS